MAQVSSRIHHHGNHGYVESRAARSTGLAGPTGPTWLAGPTRLAGPTGLAGPTEAEATRPDEWHPRVDVEYVVACAEEDAVLPVH